MFPLVLRHLPFHYLDFKESAGAEQLGLAISSRCTRNADILVLLGTSMLQTNGIVCLNLCSLKRTTSAKSFGKRIKYIIILEEIGLGSMRYAIFRSVYLLMQWYHCTAPPKPCVLPSAQGCFRSRWHDSLPWRLAIRCAERRPWQPNFLNKFARQCDGRI